MSGAVNTPDRTFVDDLGRQWEWCGGEAGTWAWRITRLSQAVMSGDVGARARELLAAYEDGYPVNTCGKHTGRASNRCLLPAEHEGPHDDDPPPFTFPNDLAAELVEELEMQTSLQGLSVKIPEYGEWGSETLLYLFQDFGIQPGDGYQAASSRQGDLLRSLAAAKAEVEKLRGAVDVTRVLAFNGAMNELRSVVSAEPQSPAQKALWDILKATEPQALGS